MKILLFSSVILAIVLNSCATTKTHSAQNTTQEIRVIATPQEAYKTALQLAMEMSWVINFSDPVTLSFGGTTPQKMSRWENNVNVMIKQDGAEVTIIVKSQLDHNPNSDYIHDYLGKVELELL